MPISIACPGCDTRYTLSNSVAGKTARCNKCDQVFRVPVPVPTDGESTDATAGLTIPAPANTNQTWTDRSHNSFDHFGSDEIVDERPESTTPWNTRPAGNRKRAATTAEVKVKKPFWSRSLPSAFSGISALIAVAFIGLRLFKAYTQIMGAANGLPDNPLPVAKPRVFNGERFPVLPEPARLNPGDPVPGSGPRATLPPPARGLYPAGTAPPNVSFTPLGRPGMMTRHSVEHDFGLEEIDRLTTLLERISDEASLEQVRPDLNRLTQDQPDIYNRIVASLPRLQPEETDQLARRFSAPAQKTLDALHQQLQRIQAIPTLRAQGAEIESAISKLTKGYQDLIKHAGQLEPESDPYVEVFISDVPDAETCSEIAQILLNESSAPALGGQVSVWGNGKDSAFRIWSILRTTDFATRLFPPPAHFVVKNHQIFVNNYRRNPASSTGLEFPNPNPEQPFKPESTPEESHQEPAQADGEPVPDKD